MDVNPPDVPGMPDGPTEPGKGPDERPPPPAFFPPWSRAFLRQASLWLIAAIVAGLLLSRLADSLAHRRAGIFQMIVVSLFLSFAIEPAVGWLARKGWRRGAATGLIFLGVVAVGAGLLALLIPALVTGSRQRMTRPPGLPGK